MYMLYAHTTVTPPLGKWSHVPLKMRNTKITKLIIKTSNSSVATSKIAIKMENIKFICMDVLCSNPNIPRCCICSSWDSTWLKCKGRIKKNVQHLGFNYSIGGPIKTGFARAFWGTRHMFINPRPHWFSLFGSCWFFFCLAHWYTWNCRPNQSHMDDPTMAKFAHILEALKLLGRVGWLTTSRVLKIQKALFFARAGSTLNAWNAPQL